MKKLLFFMIFALLVPIVSATIPSYHFKNDSFLGLFGIENATHVRSDVFCDRDGNICANISNMTSGGVGDITAVTAGDMLDGGGTAGAVTLDINMTEFNDSVDVRSNFTTDGNFTFVDKFLRLISIDLAEMDNSVSAFIINTVSDLTNYFTKTEINAQHLDMNNSRINNTFWPLNTSTIINSSDSITINETYLDAFVQGVVTQAYVSGLSFVVDTIIQSWIGTNFTDLEDRKLNLTDQRFNNSAINDTDNIIGLIGDHSNRTDQDILDVAGVYNETSLIPISTRNITNDDDYQNGTQVNETIKKLDTNFSTACALGEYGDGRGECFSINLTIDERTASTTYLPWNITTLEGTHTQGNLTSILTPEDDDSYNVTIDTGANPLLIEVNFTRVSTFDSVIGRVYFEDTSTHRIKLEIFRVDTGEWELYREFLATGDFVNFYIPVYDPESHINETNVSIRFDHIQSGLPNHYFRIDYIALVDGWTTMTNADLGSLGGRDDYTLLPWAMPTNGSLRNHTGDIYTDGIFYGGWNGSGLYYLKTVIDALLLDINGSIPTSTKNLSNDDEFINWSHAINGTLAENETFDGFYPINEVDSHIASNDSALRTELYNNIDTNYTDLQDKKLNLTDPRFNDTSFLSGNCTDGEVMFGVQENGSKVCITAVGGAGGAGLWVDIGAFLSPNATYASYINATLYTSHYETNMSIGGVVTTGTVNATEFYDDGVLLTPSGAHSNLTGEDVKGHVGNFTEYNDTILHYSTAFSGDVSGTYGALIVLTTQGLSQKNITLDADWDIGSYYIRATYFYSDVATGTAPLTVASTTQVANFNTSYAGLCYSVADDVIVKADFADEDWGDMTVSSNSVTLDTDSVQDNEIDYTAVTLTDFTNDVNFIANDTDGRIGKLNVTEQGIFMKNITIEQDNLYCFNGTSCEVWTAWNGSCLIVHTPTTEIKQGSAC